MSDAICLYPLPLCAQITPYEAAVKESWIGKELFAVRNTHAAFHYGTLAGMMHTALSWWVALSSRLYGRHYLTAAIQTARIVVTYFPSPLPLVSVELAVCRKHHHVPLTSPSLPPLPFMTASSREGESPGPSATPHPTHSAHSQPVCTRRSTTPNPTECCPSTC